MSEYERDSLFLGSFRDRDTARRFTRRRKCRRKCACAVTPLPTFIILVTIGPLATHQILSQSVKRFPKYEDGVTRAHVPMYATNDVHKTHSLGL